jgi:hypothetical protein
MLAVRRREHDRVDRRVGEDLVETVLQRDAVLGTERLGLGPSAGLAGGEAEGCAFALHRADQCAAQPADPDNRRTDHRVSP